MTDFHYFDDQFGVGHAVHDSVVPLAHAVALLSRELLSPRRPWVVPQRLNAVKDAPDIFLGYAAKILRY